MNLRTYIIIAFFLSAIAMAKAQEGLEIQQLFQQYGKSKGVTMVELSDKDFGDYKFSLFKSITISVNKNNQAAEVARKYMEKDQAKAKKVQQVMVNGVPKSVALELPKLGKNYRLVLFNELTKPENKIVVIYIESEANSEDVLKFILKKK